ncbi:hypothetical protein PACTADRAFT_45686 [Pachysolen tannophilus NRRL Y-2460]|uniref:Mitochondrial carrier protein n=1 Tax=Pachysolen tannophilus NRRL Y-2460 TaxID=669874 RepID=A0A1E4TPX5_PACTA|nr:hypothetical protein PACTADRAFT_45686 [Pachysolen tannophilus NRRL Y-2460]
MSLTYTNRESSPVTPAITGDIQYNNVLFTFPDSLQPWKPTILSYSSSVASTIIGYPLDSMKTRMQTHKFQSAFACFKQTLHHEGFKGFYRGMSAPLITASCSKSLGVSLYTWTKPELGNFLSFFYNPKVDHSAEPFKLALLNFPVSMASGFLAGSLVSFFACPFEFTKLFAQISVLVGNSNKLGNRHVPRTTFQVCKQIFKTEGVTGLYSGFRYHLLRDSINNSLFFATYETIKISFKALTSTDGTFMGTNLNAGPATVAMAGAFSGILSWATVFPIDTIKSLTQKDIVLNILRVQAGQKRLPVTPRTLTFPTRRMYRGLGPSLTRSILVTMTFFSVYEYLMSHIV